LPISCCMTLDKTLLLFEPQFHVYTMGENNTLIFFRYWSVRMLWEAPSTHSFTHPPTYPSTHPSVHPFIHPTTQLSSTYPFTNLLTYPSIHLSTHLPIYSSIHPSIHPYIHSSLQSSICPPTHTLGKVAFASNPSF
jgi:hypothetical protein